MLAEVSIQASDVLTICLIVLVVVGIVYLIRHL